jgi:aspartate oxidase
LPRGKREAEKSKIVVNKGEVENIDVSFANGKMAKVANNGERAENGYTFSDKLVVGDLDCITHAVYDLHHEAPVKCDDMLLAVLIVVGA